MSEDTDRLIKWLAWFIGAVAIVGVLCGFGLGAFGIIRSAPWVPDYVTEQYTTIGDAIMIGSLAIMILWAIFVTAYRARSGQSDWWKGIVGIIIGIPIILALSQLDRVTGDPLLAALVGLGLLLILEGIRRLWGSKD